MLLDLVCPGLMAKVPVVEMCKDLIEPDRVQTRWD